MGGLFLPILFSLLPTDLCLPTGLLPRGLLLFLPGLLLSFLPRLLSLGLLSLLPNLLGESLRLSFSLLPRLTLLLLSLLSGEGLLFFSGVFSFNA